MQKDEVQKALDRFKDHIIAQAKRNLTKGGKYGTHNVSKKLYNSIEGEVKVFPNSIGMYFSMEEYGAYQDLGVKGKNSASKAPKSPYRFGSGKGKEGGLTAAIEKWVKQRRIQFKSRETGMKLSYKNTSFLITRSIYSKGIKPSLFFTKPFEAAYKNLPNELIDKYGLEASKLFNDIIKQPK
jgi:hypothetical protein